MGARPVGMETEGSAIQYAWGWHMYSKDNHCLPRPFSTLQRVNVFGVLPHVPSQDGESGLLLQPGSLFGCG